MHAVWPSIHTTVPINQTLAAFGIFPDLVLSTPPPPVKMSSLTVNLCLSTAHFSLVFFLFLSFLKSLCRSV